TTWLYSKIGQDKDGNEIRLCDVIEDPQMSISDRIIFEENKNKIRTALEVLNERELEIISRRFGLDNRRVETQREIAKSLDISRSYVSRIEKRALTKLYLQLKK
ncbi:MAG TPA: sigma-70 family RNA polymerase sigma factor, partial [Bacilli bacterium]